jgi:putative transposase
VRSGRQWPGLWSAPERIGGDAAVIRRPKGFFDPKGSLPEAATLELVAPPGFESVEAFRERLIVALGVREEQALADHRGRFMGAGRVLAQKPTARPASREPRRTLNPRVAARDKWKRIEVLGRLLEFLQSYRAAWNARCGGDLTPEN